MCEFNVHVTFSLAKHHHAHVPCTHLCANLVSLNDCLWHKFQCNHIQPHLHFFYSIIILQSAGMVVYFILSGGKQPIGAHPRDVVWNLSRRNLRMNNISEEAYHLLSVMISLNKAERPATSEALRYIKRRRKFWSAWNTVWPFSFFLEGAMSFL